MAANRFTTNEVKFQAIQFLNRSRPDRQAEPIGKRIPRLVICTQLIPSYTNPRTNQSLESILRSQMDCG
jgi:hypothetical protein